MRKNLLCSVLSAMLLSSFPLAWAAEGSSGGNGSADSDTGSGNAGVSTYAALSTTAPQTVIQVNTPTATFSESSPAAEGRADAAAKLRA